jgi:hypothetical protein
LWALKPNPLIREMGYEPPRSEIHTFKYEHEKTCADVFVTLVLTGKLLSWAVHKKLGKNIIPDRTADLGKTVYIEVEMGSQDKIWQKANAYRQYFTDNRKPFEVWFLVKDEAQLARAEQDLADFPSHYRASLLSQFHFDMRSDTSSD